jgi:hypothetical protein
MMMMMIIIIIVCFIVSQMVNYSFSTKNDRRKVFDARQQNLKKSNTPNSGLLYR